MIKNKDTRYNKIVKTIAIIGAGLLAASVITPIFRGK